MNHLKLNIETRAIEQALIDAITSGEIAQKIKDSFASMINDYKFGDMLRGAIKDFVYGRLSSLIDSELAEEIMAAASKMLDNDREELIKQAILARIGAELTVSVKERL